MRRLYLVIKEEHRLYAGGSDSVDGDWIWQFKTDYVRQLRHVKSLDEYLAEVARLDAANVADAGPKNPHPLERLLAWLRVPVERGVADSITQLIRLLVLFMAATVVAGLGRQWLVPLFGK